ncbi:MAG TPA: cysteine-rich CWC family protein, partial [Ramlibacter sp.]|nr:cysteine-rich CWC family protein [Ramlibacter sp.]
MSAEATRERPLATKTCSRCGGEFGCLQGQSGCWCEAVELTRATLAELRASADDCLCPSCLEEFAERDRRLTEAQVRRQRGWAKALPHPAVRARGVSPLWAAAAALFVLAVLVFSLANGPLSIGVGAIAASALSHLPLVHVQSGLNALESA